MYCKKCDKHWGHWVKECPKENGGCGEILSVSLEKITVVQATEMPSDVVDYCVDHEISTHYQNDIAQVYNSDNPFANWLKKNGYKFKAKPSKEGDYGEFDEIGIIAT